MTRSGRLPSFLEHPLAKEPRSRSPRPLRFEGVSRRFVTGNGVVGALESIDLVVEPGEFVCVLGPSGCGKSTLLSLAAGL